MKVQRQNDARRLPWARGRAASPATGAGNRPRAAGKRAAGRDRDPGEEACPSSVPCAAIDDIATPRRPSCELRRFEEQAFPPRARRNRRR
jgi:hypothetical protein